MIGRALAFIVIFAILQLGWQMMNGGPFQHLIIDQGVVAPTASLVHVITPGIQARAIGNKLWELNGGLNIVNGCDGTETLFMLIAAFAVAPITRQARISGLLVGIPLVWILNLVRILALFYAHHTDSELFGFLHGIVAPAVMVILVAAFYYAWLRRPNQSFASIG